MHARATIACGLILAGWASAPAEDRVAAEEKAASASPEALALFEKEVRPVLAEHCFKCHGPEKQKSELRLDGREHLLAGNASGPILRPGDAENSRLVQAIRYDGEIRMPPKEKLPAQAIEAITTWVGMGAPWPEDQGAVAASEPSQAEKARSHWSFAPVRQPPLPPVKDPAWTRSPIDHFILAGLESEGLSPSPPAERRTLIRRVTFDLIGLPPTPEEVEAFVGDESSDAFAKVVDRLLASPHYGERWGRYWLDVARYADTKGYVFKEDRRYPFAYVYRDWVIEALNKDLPYDQFLMQQLAADRLPRTDDSALAAMGFLTVGRRFLENKHDIIDDRIDVVARGMMGLTVTCARCHDHKFDPIPTADYYSLYGVFAASVERTVALVAPSAEYQQELRAREEKLAEFLRTKQGELFTKLRAQTKEYLAAAHSMKDQPNTRDFEFAEQSDLRPRLVNRWRNYLNGARDRNDPVFVFWHAFEKLPQENFAASASEVCARITAGQDPQQRSNPLVARLFQAPPNSFDEVVERYAGLLSDIDRQWQAALAVATSSMSPAPMALPDTAAEELRQVFYAEASPLNMNAEGAGRMLDKPDREQAKSLREKVAEWTRTAGAPKQAMSLEDAGEIRNSRILVRGNAGNPGPEVPRQFLGFLAGTDRQPFQEGSGRAELARAIAAKDNPLTARVLVNRVWLNHFGAALVRTPSDFGLRSEPPSHPELLDFLAWKFMDEGWSLKKLHREMVLSSTYQQSSEDNAQSRAKDPENRWLWRMNRRRLDFEALRDGLLAASGQVERAAGGPAVELASEPFSHRRTIYGLVDRTNLPGMYRTFDFAMPEAHSPQRHITTVPQQALFLMNHPFVIEQSKALIKRPDVDPIADQAARIQRLYAICFAREAAQDEVAASISFLNEPAGDSAVEKLTPWERYAQVLLASNEFAFVD